LRQSWKLQASKKSISFRQVGSYKDREREDEFLIIDTKQEASRIQEEEDEMTKN